MYRAANKGPGYIKVRARVLEKYRARILNLSARKEDRIEVKRNGH
jgi:hypothetical protein